jgi:hypothetical protein
LSSCNAMRRPNTDVVNLRPYLLKHSTLRVHVDTAGDSGGPLIFNTKATAVSSSLPMA